VRHTDVAVVGGGLAGSAAAAMLGRAGHQAILIDPRPLYPNDFRCEKLDASQIRLLQQMGLADAVSRAATIDQRMWIARFCRVVEKRPSGQFDLSDRCTAAKCYSISRANTHIPGTHVPVEEPSTASIASVSQISLLDLCRGPGIGLQGESLRWRTVRFHTRLVL
jgi:hypothetical protein